MHIVHGTAGGAGSERAAAWTAELTRLLHSDVEFVEAYQRRSAEEAPEVVDELSRASTADLEGWAVDHDLASIPRLALEGDPDEVLRHAAREWSADLVIIGSRDEEGATSLGFGSLAHRLAHHLECPLIVVPPGTTPLAGGTIVVGVDGSPGSERALHWASRIAAGIDGRVVGVISIDAMYETFDSHGYYGDDESAAARQIRAGDVDVELIERTGPDPASTLREVAAELDAALVVVAAKSRHSLGGMLLGAVADHMLHHPPRPVAVIPHSYKGSPEDGSVDGAPA